MGTFRFEDQTKAVSGLIRQTSKKINPMFQIVQSKQQSSFDIPLHETGNFPLMMILKLYIIVIPHISFCWDFKSRRGQFSDSGLCSDSGGFLLTPLIIFLSGYLPYTCDHAQDCFWQLTLYIVCSEKLVSGHTGLLWFRQDTFLPLLQCNCNSSQTCSIMGSP